MPERSQSPTDELEIRALVHRYADAASRRDDVVLHLDARGSDYVAAHVATRKSFVTSTGCGIWRFAESGEHECPGDCYGESREDHPAEAFAGVVTKP